MRPLLLYYAAVLPGAFYMGAGAIGDLLELGQANYISETLGYPDYFPRMLGAAKLAGSIAVLLPIFPRLTEWAFAGLFFDLAGAVASHQAVGNPLTSYRAAAIGFALLLIAYAQFSRLSPVNRRSPFATSAASSHQSRASDTPQPRPR